MDSHAAWDDECDDTLPSDILTPATTRSGYTRFDEFAPAENTTWEDPMIPPRRENPNDPIDALVASQDDWVSATDLVTEYDYLPLQIKGGEAKMTDLMIANIAEIARSEEAQLKAEVKELLSGVWGFLGFNDYAAEELNTQATLLVLTAEV
ncbi:hypothetical protein B0T26DRAFT_679913 [Lasiosphaeria miniovina]|uniref:Uncharacterized protein n=1 Tax=Lasiosphaeria miniovina TaxID=1954250 RepID=A0AA39ZYX0_9PEZI|nr:uncharacterized protein B0T26DRAFT_679913 [Lasiosphaeria miniovina]KAK0706197.1 hypothetical protein B0T26DRAFT_679913 [Lasiosphaeria miniovina]